MNVRELIEELQRHDPEKRVVVSGWEGGYDDVTAVDEIRLTLNANTALYYGKHKRDDDAGNCQALRIG